MFTQISANASHGIQETQASTVSAVTEMKSGEFKSILSALEQMILQIIAEHYKLKNEAMRSEVTMTGSVTEMSYNIAVKTKEKEVASHIISITSGSAKVAVGSFIGVKMGTMSVSNPSVMQNRMGKYQTTQSVGNEAGNTSVNIGEMALADDKEAIAKETSSRDLESKLTDGVQRFINTVGSTQMAQLIEAFAKINGTNVRI